MPVSVNPILGGEKIKDSYPKLNANDQVLADGVNANEATAVDLQQQINSIEVGDSNALIGVYKALDAVNTNDYVATYLDLTLFDALRLNLEVYNQNTGPVTVNLNGLGAKEVVNVIDNVEVPLVGGQFVGIAELQFDATRDKFKMVSLSDQSTANNLDILRTGPTVSGTADAIELLTPTTNVFDLSINLNPLTFIPTTSNTGASTVNVDGLGVKNIQKPDGSGGYLPVEANDIQIGVPVTLYRVVTGDFFLYAPKAGASDVLPILGHTLTVTGTTEIDRTTPVQVVNAAYSTSASARPQRLENGWLAFPVIDTTPNVEIHYSTDDGDTSALLFSIGDIGNNASVVVNENTIHVLYTRDSTGVVRSLSVDVTTITPGDNISVGLVDIDTGQTDIDSCSLAIAPNMDLHATWASKNATYPNSFNIRYSKSTDGGVTWSTPLQVTASNTVGHFQKNPSICIKDDGYPIIVHEFFNGSNYFLFGQAFTSDVAYAGYTIVPATTYAQSNPSADVLSDGTIIVAWFGKDSTENYDHIKFSESVDNGVTWSTSIRLTNNAVMTNAYLPSITRNKDDNIFVMTYGATPTSGGAQLVHLIERISGVWSTPVAVSTNDCITPSTCNNYRDFSKPLTIWRDVPNSDVKFYGKWTEETKEQTLLATPDNATYVYCNEDTTLNKTGGGTQVIPSVTNATDESELLTTDSGELITIGSVDKIYVGNVSQVSLGFTPL